MSSASTSKPRPRFHGLVLLLALLAVTASAAEAQITFIPRPQHSVSLAPQYVAVADFNADYFQDLVVSSNREEKVTVLLGAGGATFRNASDIRVGQQVGRVAAGDVNGDGKPDIVTIGYDQRRFYVMFNDGGAIFRAPVPYDLHDAGNQAAQLRPLDLAIGRFNNDSAGDPPEPLRDLGFVGQNFGVAGSDRGLMIPAKAGNDFDVASPVAFVAGDRPRRIILTDLNGDDYDDALVLSSGDANADKLSVLLNRAVPEGDFVVPPVDYVVGIGASTMAIGDFNNDSFTDVAVLNDHGDVTGRVFAVDVFLNIPTTRDGFTVGSGRFNIVAPVDHVSCPTTLAGIPIYCTPTEIVAADFDVDGRTDYAVAFRTAAVHPDDGRTMGVVLAKAGVGNGTFDVATGVQVGFDPGQIAAGDFDGDGIAADIVVAEEGSRAVRILEALPQELRPVGYTCLVDWICFSGNCVDGVCCSSPSCPAGQKCDVPGHAGTCSAPNQNGGPCFKTEDCAGGNCVYGFCCEQHSCPDGQFCNTGNCAPPAGNGTPCNQDEQCASGHCTDGVCCSDDRCPAGQSCNVPGFLGSCHIRLPDGDPCSDDRQCESGFCTEGVCCAIEQCQEGYSCALPNREGRCVAKPTTTSTRTITRTPTRTPTPAPLGNPCLESSQCITSFCVDNTCCESPICPQHQGCGVSGSEGMCKPQVPEGGECGKDSDCISGNCVNGNPLVCGPPKTPTSTPTPTPKPPGEPCSVTSQCEAGYFCEEDEKVCCDQLSCSSGSSCRVPGTEGFCVRLIATRTPRPHTAACSDSSQCLVGLFCTNSVCCHEPSCPEGQRCDITDHKGDCAIPNGVDEACEKSSDCAIGLVCTVIYGGERRCLWPPPPTQPPIRTNTPTASPGVTVTNCYASCGPGKCRQDAYYEGAFHSLCLPCLPPTTCIGDCNRSYTVELGELMSAVGFALGQPRPPLGSCDAIDATRDCRITIDEVVAAVHHAGSGCPEVSSCGTVVGRTCAEGQYCEYPQSSCGTTAIGECRERPTTCEGVIEPVCGCDGRTFINDCERARSGIRRRYAGPC